MRRGEMSEAAGGGAREVEEGEMRRERKWACTNERAAEKPCTSSALVPVYVEENGRTWTWWIAPITARETDARASSKSTASSCGVVGYTLAHQPPPRADKNAHSPSGSTSQVPSPPHHPPHFRPSVPVPLPQPNAHTPAPWHSSSPAPPCRPIASPTDSLRRPTHSPRAQDSSGQRTLSTQLSSRE